MSNLTTADGQKIIGGGKKLSRGGKISPGAAKKVASKKSRKSGSSRELDWGDKLTPEGGTLLRFATRQVAI